MQVLSNYRAQRTARHDDRAFGAEGSSGADADCRRDWFEHSQFGSMRLPRVRIASIASGMPWPRIFSDPNRASTPTIMQSFGRTEASVTAAG
jgi:hypothetical protein